MWRGKPAWPNYGLDGNFYYTRQDIDVQHKAIDEAFKRSRCECGRKLADCIKPYCQTVMPPKKED